MDTSDETPTITTKNYWPLALLFIVGALNLLDRQVINVLAQNIKVDLGLTDGQLGLLTGTAFGLFYATLGIPLGWLADRVDRVKLLAIYVLLWSAFTAICGLAGNFLQLFVARMGVGVGEAGSQPASTALIPDLFPEKQRTTAMSVMLVGAPIGGFLGLLLGGFVGAIGGWRIAFLVAGAPGLIAALVMMLTLRDPKPPVWAKAASGNASLLRSVGVLLRRPGYPWLIVAMICSTFLIYASGAWMPAFFIRVHGMTVAEIGTFSAIAVGPGGMAGTLIAGIASDRLRGRLRNPESNVCIIALCISVPALLTIVLADDRAAALGALFLFNACAYAFLGPMVRIIQNTGTAQTRALSLAVCSTVAGVMSLGFGLPLIGVVSDRLAPTAGPRALGYALLIVAVAGAVGAIAHWRALAAFRAAGQ